MAELCSEEEPRCRPADRIRCGLDRELGIRAAPFLILKLLPVDTDGIVKLREKGSIQRRKAGGGALMRREPLTVYLEFVALGFTAEHRVVVENETGRRLFAWSAS